MSKSDLYPESEQTPPPERVKITYGGVGNKKKQEASLFAKEGEQAEEDEFEYF